MGAGRSSEGKTAMLRTEITAELVQKVDRMLRVGMDVPTIATALGITPYVARIIARYQKRKMRGRIPARTGARVANSQKGLPATTIRRIQRMLDVKILPYDTIAREAGVSGNMVGLVARGMRLPISARRPYLTEGEQFVPEGVRCGTCGATILVLPCRACCARGEENI
jgi:hypothetical protein